MALSERSRSALYKSLTAVVHDEQAVQEMLSYFPARDVEEPVTREHLRAEVSVFRAEVQVEFAAVRSEMGNEFAAVRSEMQNEFAAVRSEMQNEFSQVRSELQSGLTDIRVELRDALRQQTQWLIGVMVTLSALVLTIAALTGR